MPLGDAHPSLQMSPELQREKTLALLVAWLLALGDLQPLLVLNEDLHWADPSSLELLGRIIDQAPTARVLLLLTARPEFEVPWSHPKNWTPIALGRLRPRQATAMVEALSDGSLPDEAVEQILKRSDGMPLYVEELTRKLVEAGEPAAASVPESLQDSSARGRGPHAPARLATRRDVQLQAHADPGHGGCVAAQEPEVRAARRDRPGARGAVPR